MFEAVHPPDSHPGRPLGTPDLGPLLAAAAHGAAPWQSPPPGVRWLLEAGLPDPGTFPAEALQRLGAEVLADDATAALQYGSAVDDEVRAGYAGLRDAIAVRTGARDGRALERGEVMLTTGAAQALMLAFEAFVDPGDAVVVEAPTWNAVLAALSRRGAEVLAAPVDGDGLQVDAVASHAERLAAEGRRIKLVYCIANFNTPTGMCLSARRRRRLVELAERYGFAVIEDDVYGDLRYRGAAPPSMLSMDDSGLVFQVGSFSKSIAPGLRLGWAVGHRRVIDALAAVRGDLGVSQWVARTVARFCESGLLEPHLEGVRACYRAKLEATETSLGRHCGDLVRWRSPDGGFFLWVELDESVDPALVMQRALADGVLCRAGERFFDDHHAGRSFFRLAFSAVPLDEIDGAIRVLGRAIEAAGARPRR